MTMHTKEENMTLDDLAGVNDLYDDAREWLDEAYPDRVYDGVFDTVCDILVDAMTIEPYYGNRRFSPLVELISEVQKLWADVE